jgi:hypothetical protein
MLCKNNPQMELTINKKKKKLETGWRDDNGGSLDKILLDMGDI